MTATIEVHVDEELKEETAALFEDLGMDLETAVRVFLKQSVAEQGIPFQIGYGPNEETISAIESVKYGIGLSKGYTSVKELIEALDADD